MIIWSSLKLFRKFMAIYSFRKYWNLRNIKLIEKLSRRHLINSSDVFIIKVCTVVYKNQNCTKYTYWKMSCGVWNQPWYKMINYPRYFLHWIIRCKHLNALMTKKGAVLKGPIELQPLRAFIFQTYYLEIVLDKQ